MPDDKAAMLNGALNKITGEWDWPKLGDLFQEFDTGQIDLEMSGFNTQEIEKLELLLQLYLQLEHLSYDEEMDLVDMYNLTYCFDAEQPDKTHFFRDKPILCQECIDMWRKRRGFTIRCAACGTKIVSLVKKRYDTEKMHFERRKNGLGFFVLGDIPKFGERKFWEFYRVKSVLYRPHLRDRLKENWKDEIDKIEKLKDLWGKIDWLEQPFIWEPRFPKLEECVQLLKDRREDANTSYMYRAKPILCNACINTWFKRLANHPEKIIQEFYKNYLKEYV